MSELRASGLPLGGTGLTTEAYLEFLGADYLAGFVRAGGAAVRFVVAGDDDVAKRWHTGLAQLSDAEGYLYVAVDAADTKVAMIDHVYAAVARRVDWASLAAQTVHRAWEVVGLPPPRQ